MTNQLTEEDKLFCELFVNGTAPFGGNAVKCYKEVFHQDDATTGNAAKQYIKQQHIQDYITELDEQSSFETSAMKRYITQNLVKIVDECSTSQFFDRRGTALSTAPLRSVAVNAAKALMDMYPVKEATVNKLDISSEGEGGITFNVIVPESKPIEE